MRKFIAGVALLRHPHPALDAWMFRRLSPSGCISPIVGERLPGESFRDAADRELAFSLQLTRGRDYVLSLVPRLHLDVALSIPSESEPCFFIVEFFVGHLMKRDRLEEIDQSGDNRWVSSGEILAGLLQSGERLYEPWPTIFQQADILPMTTEES